MIIVDDDGVMHKVVPVSVLQDILDKLRAEIEQTEFVLDKSPNLQDDRTDTEKCADWSKMFKMLVITIIDKYKAESEK